MKTTIEINGYQILISEEEGKVMVSATKDDEVVEEFTLEVEGGEDMEDSEENFGGEEGEEMMPFGGEEEEDFGGEEGEEFEEEDEDEEFEDEDEDEEEEEGKLESFNSFVKKRK